MSTSKIDLNQMKPCKSGLPSDPGTYLLQREGADGKVIGADDRPLLEKIASQVKPIMVKRNWTVGTLGEFFPSNPSLLGINMNAGQRINLRLRPPGSPDGFYEFDQLVLVMLHELTHIQFGPHDTSFYKLLAELEEEYYELKRKGYSGEGFNSSGTPLSGLKKDEYHGKLTGLAAAEKRLAVQKKIGKGGVLGGSSVLGRSMKDVLAEAAERRMRDDKICHTAHPDVQEEVKKAEEESEGVDADQLDNAGPSRITSASDQLNPAGPSMIAPAPTSNTTPLGIASRPPRSSIPAKSTPKPKPSSSRIPIPKAIPKSDIIDLTDDDPPPRSPVPTEWSCQTCTLLNPVSSRTCEACSTPNPNTPPPSKKGDGWFCDFCGSGPRDMSYWSCSECGWVRKWG